CRYVSEGAITIVVIEDIFSILRDVQIRKAVAVIITHGNALSVTARGNASLIRYVSECAVPIVPVECVAQGGIRCEKIAFAAVHQVNVHPAVVVVVEKSASSA